MSDIKVYREFVNGDLCTAILHSPGYGAGWSTWSSPDLAEFMTMDKGLVNLARSKAPERHVIAYIEEQGHEVPYMGGWEDIEIYWLPVGTKFLLDEYDGSESIRTTADLWLSA